VWQKNQGKMTKRGGDPEGYLAEKKNDFKRNKERKRGNRLERGEQTNIGKGTNQGGPLWCGVC